MPGDVGEEHGRRVRSELGVEAVEHLGEQVVELEVRERGIGDALEAAGDLGGLTRVRSRPALSSASATRRAMSSATASSRRRRTAARSRLPASSITPSTRPRAASGTNIAERMSSCLHDLDVLGGRGSRSCSTCSVRFATTSAWPSTSTG